jgi:hypothetical protein
MKATLQQLLAYQRKVIPLSIFAFFLFTAGILISVVTYFWFPANLLKMQSITMMFLSLAFIVKNMETTATRKIFLPVE